MDAIGFPATGSIFHGDSYLFVCNVKVCFEDKAGERFGGLWEVGGGSGGRWERVWSEEEQISNLCQAGFLPILYVEMCGQLSIKCLFISLSPTAGVYYWTSP